MARAGSRRLAERREQGRRVAADAVRQTITDEAVAWRSCASSASKVIVYTGLVDDAESAGSNVNYHEHVVTGRWPEKEMKSHADVSAAGGPRTIIARRGLHSRRQERHMHSRNCPGNTNQTPTREQDQFFMALVDWVEKRAPRPLKSC